MSCEREKHIQQMKKKWKPENEKIMKIVRDLSWIVIGKRRFEYHLIVEK